MYEIPDFDININDYVDIPNSTGNRDLDLFLGLAPSRINGPILSLDDIALPLKSCKISPSLEIRESDTSGQTSSTSSAEQGNKGVALKISGIIPFNDPTTLKNLIELAKKQTTTTKTVTDHGKYGLTAGKTKTTKTVVRPAYIIACELAKTLKIRQVKFAGNVTADEMQNLRAWSVSFTLREHISANEMLEKQQIKENESDSLLLNILSIPKGLLQSVNDTQGTVDTIMDDIQKQIQDQFK